MSDGDRAPADIVRPDGTTGGGTGSRGSPGGSEDRTPLMSVPEVRQLSDALVENGYGDLVDKTEAFLEIDTTAMKVAALVAYGLPEQGSRPVGPTPGTPLTDLGNPNPDTFIVRNAPNTLSLEQFAEIVTDSTLDFLRNRWQGSGFDAFVLYMNRVQWVVNREGERLRTIGQALYEVAEAIERSQDDAEMTFWGAVGLAMTGRGLGTALLSGSGVLAALAGGLVTAVSNGEGAAARASELASREIDSELDLRHPEYMGQGPREHLKGHRSYKDPEDWRMDPDG